MKLEPIREDIPWSVEAAVSSAMEVLKDYPEAQIVVMFRETKNNTLNYRAANVTNAECIFLAEEFKHSIINKCFDCRCETRESER